VPAMLTVIGEALVDLVDSGDHTTYKAHPGGSPLNVAVGLARLGEPVALMARLAGDAFGRLLRGHAERNGVDLSAAAVAAEPTTLAVVSLDERGGATYDFYLDGTADWQWKTSEMSLPRGTEIVHFGSLASWTPPGDSVIREVVRVRGGTSLVSYDPNVRPALLGEPARGRDLVRGAAALATVVKASEEDATWLYPGESLGDVAQRWLAADVTRLVVITQGASGATAFRRGRPPLVRPSRPIIVVDTVGAGDACMAGLLAGLSRAAATSPAAVEAMSDAVLTGIVDDALLVAALTCTRPGADPPTRAELDSQRAVR
jgi:fructokinase